jgi:quinol-cytochrome oxidoreductase complex cytochrome b subunit
MFFIVVYLHTFRGFYFSSYTYPKEPLWIVGVFYFTFNDYNRFFWGYVLPWGQMSFWGATVITNLVSAIPIFEIMVKHWFIYFGGGFAIVNATLNRFYSLHFLLPFVLFLALVILHLFFLHRDGS